MENTEQLKQLIESIARALVDVPDEVVVKEIRGEQSAIFEVRVAKADIGKILGREGRTVDSIRDILGSVGKKLKHRYFLEILE